MKNTFTKLSIPLSITLTPAVLKEQLGSVLNCVDFIYSYIVYNCFGTEKQLKGWHIDVLVCDNDEYNTLVSSEVVTDIVNILQSLNMCPSNPGVAGYKQPPLEVMYTVYKPLMYRMATDQHKHWQDIPVEDLFQMCCLQLTLLYGKGYYVNRRLLYKSYVNMILMSLRSQRYAPILLSYEATVLDGNMPLSDTIEDENSSDVIENMYGSVEDEVNRKKIELIKSIISDRTYDQLIFEYGTHNTTPMGRRISGRIRDELKEMDITTNTILKNVLGR